MNSHANNPMSMRERLIAAIQMTTTRVLIVDDDQEIGELMKDYLSGFNMVADVVTNGDAMRKAIYLQRYDVIILDVMLPGDDGLTLCRELRHGDTPSTEKFSLHSVPIIMVTARGESADKILGLELGADDYIVKPFEPRELIARIKTVLRRSRPETLSNEVDPNICFSGWQLSRTLRQVIAPDGLLVPLSNAEFRLLMTFIEHPRRVLTRDQLIDKARGRSMEIFDRSIDLLVSRLRQKLNDDPKEPLLIKTVRGEGYYFDATISNR